MFLYVGLFTGYKFFIPMSLFCLGMAGWLLYTKAYRYSRLKKVCTYPVEARMFTVDYKHGGRGGRFWNITYEFYFSERRYLVNNDFWEQIGSWNKPQEGDVVTIYVNPVNPEEIYDIVAKKGRSTGIIMGSFFVVLAVFMLFLPLFD